MGKRSKDLIITKNPKSLFSESIRSIRTNLAFASIDKDVKIIMSRKLYSFRDINILC